jgi:hypothetical protein
MGNAPPAVQAAEVQKFLVSPVAQRPAVAPAAARPAAASAPSRLSQSAQKKRPFQTAFQAPAVNPPVPQQQQQSQGPPPDPDATPSNPTETRLVAEMEQMGFPDRREILRSIRFLLDGNSANLTADDVMLFIITEREEAEEARKEDQARLASERTRKEEAARRRNEIAREFDRKLLQSSLDEWASDQSMFCGSWVLGVADVKTALAKVVVSNLEFKKKLVELLKLEKLARKWFGSMPRAYFCERVVARLLEQSEQLMSQVSWEFETLQRVMYTLSEQQGGVPRCFLEAHDQSSTRDDDDEILVLQTISPREQSASQESVEAPSITSSAFLESLGLTREGELYD